MVSGSNDTERLLTLVIGFNQPHLRLNRGRHLASADGTRLCLRMYSNGNGRIWR